MIHDDKKAPYGAFLRAAQASNLKARGFGKEFGHEIQELRFTRRAIIQAKERRTSDLLISRRRANTNTQNDLLDLSSRRAIEIAV